MFKSNKMGMGYEVIYGKDQRDTLGNLENDI